MSIAVLKKKASVRYQSKLSGVNPGGHWLPQGPFTHNANNAQQLADAIAIYGPKGFSINGGIRNSSYIGKSMAMSQSKASPYRGIHARGFGGKYGHYPQFPLPHPETHTEHNDSAYIKPSVLSATGMINRKYQYPPNAGPYLKQPYTGNHTDMASQSFYLRNKTAANSCDKNKVNNVSIYNNHINDCDCKKGKAVYTKTIHQAISYDQYLQYLTNSCDS